MIPVQRLVVPETLLEASFNGSDTPAPLSNTRRAGVSTITNIDAMMNPYDIAPSDWIGSSWPTPEFDPQASGNHRSLDTGRFEYPGTAATQRRYSGFPPTSTNEERQHGHTPPLFTQTTPVEGINPYNMPPDQHVRSLAATNATPPPASQRSPNLNKANQTHRGPHRCQFCNKVLPRKCDLT